MNLTKTIESIFKKFLPAPFTIAVLLTLLTICLAFLNDDTKSTESITNILNYWENGIWNPKLLVFAFQMILILVLGHVLVLSKPIDNIISKLVKHTTSTSTAVLLVSFTTLLVAFINWGLGLIFGAILARKVGEYAQKHNIPINYPIVGASGYVGLMVWHSGISGSAPLDAAGNGRIQELLSNASLANNLNLPSEIATSSTIFSSWNLIIFSAIVITIPMFLYFVAKKTTPTPLNLPTYTFNTSTNKKTGAEQLDHSKILAWVFGIIILIVFCLKYGEKALELNVTLNAINFLTLGLALLFHGRFFSFLKALEEAIKGASGIIIQFPLYFGIMGIMTSTGMVSDISDFFASVATTTKHPIFTFFSAGLVNIFVPSGGGQWVIQGPIVLESALKLGVPLPKAIMALAYGDQITNMLQPFWALPLLGITKLKAKEILPYTLLVMLVGSAIYILGLLIF
ncbi:MAG: short-chain fatty acid transporter [Flavobacteriaceae bacterium]